MAGDVDWIAGKRGYVKYRIETDDDSEQFGWAPFNEWSLPMHAEFLKRNTFRQDVVQGYQDGVTGFRSGKITFKGPWTEDAAPIASGHTYDVLLGITDDGPLEYAATIHVTDVTASNTAEDGPMLDVSGDTIGPFDVASIGTDGGLADV